MCKLTQPQVIQEYQSSFSEVRQSTGLIRPFEQGPNPDMNHATEWSQAIDRTTNAGTASDPVEIPRSFSRPLDTLPGQLPYLLAPAGLQYPLGSINADDEVQLGPYGGQSMNQSATAGSFTDNRANSIGRVASLSSSADYFIHERHQFPRPRQFRDDWESATISQQQPPQRGKDNHQHSQMRVSYSSKSLRAGRNPPKTSTDDARFVPSDWENAYHGHSSPYKGRRSSFNRHGHTAFSRPYEQHVGYSARPSEGYRHTRGHGHEKRTPSNPYPNDLEMNFRGHPANLQGFDESRRLMPHTSTQRPDVTVASHQNSQALYSANFALPSKGSKPAYPGSISSGKKIRPAPTPTLNQGTITFTNVPSIVRMKELSDLLKDFVGFRNINRLERDKHTPKAWSCALFDKKEDAESALLEMQEMPFFKDHGINLEVVDRETQLGGSMHALNTLPPLIDHQKIQSSRDDTVTTESAKDDRKQESSAEVDGTADLRKMTSNTSSGNTPPGADKARLRESIELASPAPIVNVTLMSTTNKGLETKGHVISDGKGPQAEEAPESKKNHSAPTGPNKIDRPSLNENEDGTDAGPKIIDEDSKARKVKVPKSGRQVTLPDQVDSTASQDLKPNTQEFKKEANSKTEPPSLDATSSEFPTLAESINRKVQSRKDSIAPNKSGQPRNRQRASISFHSADSSVGTSSQNTQGPKKGMGQIISTNEDRDPPQSLKRGSHKISEGSRQSASAGAQRKQQFGSTSRGVSRGQTRVEATTERKLGSPLPGSVSGTTLASPGSPDMSGGSTKVTSVHEPTLSQPSQAQYEKLGDVNSVVLGAQQKLSAMEKVESPKFTNTASSVKAQRSEKIIGKSHEAPPTSATESRADQKKSPSSAEMVQVSPPKIALEAAKFQQIDRGTVLERVSAESGSTQPIVSTRKKKIKSKINTPTKKSLSTINKPETLVADPGSTAGSKYPSITQDIVTVLEPAVDQGAVSNDGEKSASDSITAQKETGFKDPTTTQDESWPAVAQLASASSEHDVDQSADPTSFEPPEGGWACENPSRIFNSSHGKSLAERATADPGWPSLLRQEKEIVAAEVLAGGLKHASRTPTGVLVNRKDQSVDRLANTYRQLEAKLEAMALSSAQYPDGAASANLRLKDMPMKLRASDGNGDYPLGKLCSWAKENEDWIIQYPDELAFTETARQSIISEGFAHKKELLEFSTIYNEAHWLEINHSTGPPSVAIAQIALELVKVMPLKDHPSKPSMQLVKDQSVWNLRATETLNSHRAMGHWNNEQELPAQLRAENPHYSREKAQQVMASQLSRPEDYFFEPSTTSDAPDVAPIVQPEPQILTFRRVLSNQSAGQPSIMAFNGQYQDLNRLRTEHEIHLLKQKIVLAHKTLEDQDKIPKEGAAKDANDTRQKKGEASCTPGDTVAELAEMDSANKQGGAPKTKSKNKKKKKKGKGHKDDEIQGRAATLESMEVSQEQVHRPQDRMATMTEQNTEIQEHVSVQEPSKISMPTEIAALARRFEGLLFEGSKPGTPQPRKNNRGSSFPTTSMAQEPAAEVSEGSSADPLLAPTKSETWQTEMTELLTSAVKEDDIAFLERIGRKNGKGIAKASLDAATANPADITSAEPIKKENTPFQPTYAEKASSGQASSEGQGPVKEV